MCSCSFLMQVTSLSYMPNSQFRMTLWRFTRTAWKCAKTSLQTLVTKELVAASWQRTVSHFLFHQGISDQNQHYWCPPTHLTLLCCSNWTWCWKADILVQLKWLGQAVLNTLTDRDFQDAFKIWQKCWEGCISAEWDYFEGEGGQ
jgi:hypothetical protein